MNNNKGFTMVELLAVITILGLLMGIGVATIQKSTDKAKYNFYKSQRTTIQNAASSYLADHKNEYPKYVGSTSSITLRKLQTNKYLGSFTDHSKKANSCNPDNTKVVVIKTDLNRFSYRAVLKCDSITDEDLRELNPRTKSFATEWGKLKIDFSVPTGYKVKKWTYVIHKTNSNGPVIRTNTVNLSTPTDVVSNYIYISDITNPGVTLYTEVYFITTNGRFGHFTQ